MEKRKYTKVEMIRGRNHSDAGSRKNKAGNSGLFGIGKGPDNELDQSVQSEAKESGGVSAMTAHQRAAENGLDISHHATDDGLDAAILDAK